MKIAIVSERIMPSLIHICGVAREAAREQRDHDDRRGAEHARRQPVRGDAVEPDGRPQREVGGVQRRMPRARQLRAVEEPPHGIDVERAVRERVGLPVVVERVAPQAVPVVAG
jgi:hypothetical protein